ncbi:MAG: hypothetical protein K6G03_02195 [Lachnospiraceae bacterium]|nr:hypothetical protein [Lachnospiraceae bacterium]
MLSNSSNVELSNKIREDIELSENHEWNGWVDINNPEMVAGSSSRFKSSYVQKRPTARKNKMFGSSEDSMVNIAKKTFEAADLCTVREQARLSEYFETHTSNENPVAGAVNAVNDETLKNYVNSILGFSFSEKSLTDDYLSEHIAEIYEFSRKLSKYEDIKGKYPEFFDRIPETKRITLDLWAKSGESLKNLVDAHLKLHGIEFRKTRDGKTKVALKKQKKNQAGKINKNLYEQLHKEFIKEAFDERVINRAKLLTEDNFANESKAIVDKLKEKLKGNKDATELFASQIETAFSEIQKAMDLRDTFIAEQKDNLKKHEKGKGILFDIKKTTRKLYLCSEHIENYKAYLNFLNGSMGAVTKDVSDFLIREKHDDLLEPIKFKTQLDCIEEAVLINERIIRGVAGYNKYNAPRIKKDKFYEKRRLYTSGKDKAAEFNTLRDTTKNKIESLSIKEEADKYAKDNHLKEVQIRFAKNFYDPNNEIIKEGDLKWIYLAGSYEPTAETPEKAKKEISEKGIKPYLNMFLSINSENIKDYDIGKNIDYKEEGFFKKYTILQFGFDMQSMFDAMSNYDVSVSDEDYIKLKAFGKTAQSMVYKISNYETMINHPFFNLLGQDDRITGDANRIYLNIFKKIEEDGEIDNPEVASFYRKYSKETLGFDVNYIHPRSKQDRQENIPIMLLEHIKPFATRQHMEAEYNDDIKVEYNRCIAEERASIKTEKAKFESEKKVMKEYIPDATDEMIKVRLAIKNRSNENDHRISNQQSADWKRVFGDKTSGSADIRSFKYFLKPVETDLNGTVKEEYYKNYLDNQQVIKDYLAGGRKRLDVVKEFAKEIIKIDIDYEKLNPEYIRENFLDLHEKVLKSFGFLNIAKDFTDFLESDEFTEEERKSLRLKFTNNQYLATLNAILGYYRNYYGLEVTGKEMVKPGTREDLTKKAWMDSRLEETGELLTECYKTLNENIKQQKKMEEKYETEKKQHTENSKNENELSKKHGITIDNMSEHYALINHNKTDHDERYKKFSAALAVEEKNKSELKKKMDAEKDLVKHFLHQAEINRVDTKIRELYKQYGFTENETKNIWNDANESAKELNDYALALIDKDKLSDKAKVYAADNGFGIFTDKEVESARFNLDKANITARFGNVDDETIKVRLVMKDYISRYAKAFPAEEKSRFLKNNSGKSAAGNELAMKDFIIKNAKAFTVDEEKRRILENTSVKAAADADKDMKCISYMLLPVKRDIFGKALPGYEKNEQKNKETVDDYLSADKNKKNKVLKDMALEILNMDLSAKVFTEENFRKNTEDVMKTYEKLAHFSGFYMRHSDFYTGPEFTDDQKKKLKRYVGGDTSLGKEMIAVLGSYINKYYMNGDGEDIEGFDSIIDNAEKNKKINEAKQSAKQFSDKHVRLLKDEFEKNDKDNETEKRWGKEINGIDHLDALRQHNKANLDELWEDINELIYNRKTSLKEQSIIVAMGLLGVKPAEADKLMAFDPAEVDKMPEFKKVKNIKTAREDEFEKRFKGEGLNEKITGARLQKIFMKNGFDHNRYDADAYEAELKSNAKLYEKCGPAIDQIIAQYRKDVEETEGAVAGLLKEKDTSNNIDTKAVEIYGLHKALEAYKDLSDLITKKNVIITRDTERMLSDRKLTDVFGVVLADMLILRNDELLTDTIKKKREEEEAKNAEEAKILETRKRVDEFYEAKNNMIKEMEKMDERFKKNVSLTPETRKIIQEADDNREKHAYIEKYWEDIKKQDSEREKKEAGISEEAKKEEVKKEEVKKEEVKKQDKTDAKSAVEGEAAVPENALAANALKKEKLPIEELRKIYTSEAKEEHMASLQAYIKENPIIKEVPKDRDQLVALRGPFYGVDIYTYHKDGTRDHDQTWRKNVDPILKYHFDWLMKYFTVNDRSLDLNMNADEKIKEIQHKDYKVSIELPGMDEGYEKQDTENCFCCTAIAMISNMYAKRKKSGRYERRGSQYDMRKYQPLILKYDPELEEKASVDLEQYYGQANDLYRFCGEGKSVAGNIFEEADYLLESLEKDGINDVCVNRMNFNIPTAELLKKENEKIKAGNQMEIFKEKAAEVLSNGDVVGVFRTIGGFRHYVTVTGIDGNTLTYYDSSAYSGHASKMDINNFFDQATTVEMNWLSDMKKPEELTKEYSNLTYDEKTGFGLKQLEPDNVRYVGHTRGVTLKKDYQDGDQALNGVVQSIYIPNRLKNYETMTLSEFNAYYEKEKAAKEKAAEEQAEAVKKEAEKNEELVKNAVSQVTVTKEKKKTGEKKAEKKKAGENKKENTAKKKTRQ